MSDNQGRKQRETPKTGGDGIKKPATHFLGFNGNTGEITLVKGRKSDADYSKSTISKFSAIVLTPFINSIGGGDMDDDTSFSSTPGWGAEVPYDVRYEEPDGKNRKVTEHKGVKWDKNHPLKKLGAKFQRNIYILLYRKDGKNIEPVICQMDVYGMNLMQYSKMEPFGGRKDYFGWKISVEGSEIAIDGKKIARRVQLFDFSEVDKVKGKELLAQADKAMMEHVDPYIDAIIARKTADDDGPTTKHPAANAGAEYNESTDDDDDFVPGKVDGDVELNKWGLPIYDDDGNELEYDAHGNLIDPPPF